MPPFRGLDLFSNGGRRSPSLRLYFAHRPETASRESFLEFTKKDYEKYVLVIYVSTDLGTEWSG
jgi:hypothetical protein